MRVCYKCNSVVTLKGRVGREELCSECSVYLHCCRNCSFYDEGAHNKCREPQAELVGDKGSGNFCDYFQFGEGALKAGGASDSREKSRSQLDRLFKTGKQ